MLGDSKMVAGLSAVKTGPGPFIHTDRAGRSTQISGQGGAPSTGGGGRCALQLILLGKPSSAIRVTGDGSDIEMCLDTYRTWVALHMVQVQYIMIPGRATAKPGRSLLLSGYLAATVPILSALHARTALRHPPDAKASPPNDSGKRVPNTVLRKI